MAGVSGNEHRLDPPAVPELEDELPGAIGRELIADDRRSSDGEALLQSPLRSFDRFVICSKSVTPWR